MVRLKFFLFALVVLGIWLAHLQLISPLGERALEMARARSPAAPAALDGRIQQRRGELQRLLLKAVATTSAASALQGVKGSRLDAAANDRLAAIRADLKDVIPEDLKGQLILGAAGDSVGSLSLSDDGDRTQGLDLPAIAAQAGADGLIQDLGGTQYIFYSKDIGPARLVVGAPLLPDKAAEAIAAELDLAAIAILQKGKVVAIGGPEKASVELLAKNTRAGKPEYIKRGDTGSFGPIRLPLFAAGGEPGAAGAPLWVATRRSTQSPSTEVVSVVSLKPFMVALADYQNLALWIFTGLLALSILVGLIIRPAKQPQAEAEQPEESSANEPPFASAEAVPPMAGSDNASGAPPFPFEPSSEERLATSIPPPVPTAQSDEEREEPTRAYPALSEEYAPESAPPEGESLWGAAPEPESNPEATRLAPVPEELLRATVEPPPLQTADDGDGDEETQHFHEVYRDFLSTRKKCGELADGLSYEKFAAKLQKNRDQLVEKYSCRTVRFQVYVKEGKAALKATPIRE